MVTGKWCCAVSGTGMMDCEMRRCEGMNEVGYCLMCFWDDRFVVRWFQNFNVVSFFSDSVLSVNGRSEY